MTIKTAKIIFWVGTLSSLLIFLVLTFDTIGQMPERTKEKDLTEEAVAGKRVFEKYNCNDCHTILGIGGYYAPDLTRVYGRRGPGYIKKVVLDPVNTLKNSIRKMPKKYAGGKEVKPDEAEKLIAFFKWVDGIDTNKWPAQDHKEKTFGGEGISVSQLDIGGGALIRKNGCLNCHMFKGLGGSFGPALDDIGFRLDQVSIKEVIQNGRGDMPAQSNVSSEDREALSAFLFKQKGGE